MNLSRINGVHKAIKFRLLNFLSRIKFVKGRNRIRFNTSQLEFMKKIPLSIRLNIFVLILLISSISVVGITSYQKARETTLTTIEERLIREVNTTADIAWSLTFAYVGDEDAF